MVDNPRISVPKLSSQVGNPKLYETLRDMLLETARFVREVAAPRKITGPSLLGLSAEKEDYVEQITTGYGLSLVGGSLYVSMSGPNLLGRYSSGDGVAQPVSVGSGLSLSGGGVLSCTVTPKVLKTQVYTSGSGTFTTGAGVTFIIVTACAGGGGAGGIETDTAHGGAGGGGGGDSIYRKGFTVTASTGYAYAVGAAGTAGTDNVTTASVTDGGTGGTTSLGALFSLTGGAGGQKATTTGYGLGGAAGGPGGTRGETGQPATADRSGANAVHGNGGISFPGGYGAGGTRSGDSAARAGNSGYLLIEWYE